MEGQGPRPSTPNRYPGSIISDSSWRDTGRPAESGFPGILAYGVYEVQFWIRSVIDSLKLMAAGRVSGDDIAGPVRIVTIIDDDGGTESYPMALYTVLMNLFNLTVMFSANLGVMNLIPIPALDGGRLSVSD